MAQAYPEQLLTPDEVAKALKVSRSQIYKMMSAKSIKTVKVGSLRRIRPADLAAYIDGQAA
ncbi:MAG: helix-turn-helix domain-containing protein [Chloroflexota bacterium]